MATEEELDLIKRTAIVAMFSDDELMDLLVLKGGNAMDIIHQANSRASVDLDFSMESDFDYESVQSKVDRVIQDTFAQHKYHAFDVKMTQKPGKMPEDLASFWGGYLVEFKLIAQKRADEVEHDPSIMRREAIRLGEGTRFTIDISRHEYIADKEEYELDGYVIYAYPPDMIVSEKLRAICQQMPEYAEIIQRNGLGNQRARDFLDIEVLVRMFSIDLATERVRVMVEQMFAAKRVPLELLGKIGQTRDFHAQGYEAVRATMKPGVEVKPFDDYFDFVVDACRGLEPLWNV
ncbi:nucleotidyl transferase AbiEii/AbiGii toxin family protein [Azoarcus communis]|nr:nucleotidyl transferase AbiEii/AbiGii toxin family protein [Parazoarcus communis]